MAAAKHVELWMSRLVARTRGYWHAAWHVVISRAPGCLVACMEGARASGPPRVRARLEAVLAAEPTGLHLPLRTAASELYSLMRLPRPR